MTQQKPVRIPYDSFTLSAVVLELQGFIGGKVQEIRQPSEFEVSISLYSQGTEGIFLVSCHPEYARAHFITKRLSNQPKPPVFCSTLRTRLEGARLVLARQIQGDRVLELEFESPLGEHSLVAELMGKHSHLVLIDSESRIVSAARWVGQSISSRPIQPNLKYILPPVMTPGDTGRKSPFLVKLLEATGQTEPGPIEPVISPSHGAYPVSVAALGLPEFSRTSVSIALEQHFDLEIPRQATEALRSSLLARLRRLLLAREVALTDLKQAEEAGGRAASWQRMGEIVLAYGSSAPEGTSDLVAWDYDGSEVAIKLDPTLDFKLNANRYFEKAKKAKGRLGTVKDQLSRIGRDRSEILAMIAAVEREERLIRLQDLERESFAKKWLNQQTVPAANKEDRPYDGFRVRFLLGPGGFTILLG